ncbi:MAG: hypothetical protein AAFX58_09315 [Pseudomonadota bacterium]
MAAAFVARGRNACAALKEAYGVPIMPGRIILVIDSLGDHTDLLRSVIDDADCSNIRFSSVEHWRDSIGDAEPAAVMVSGAIAAADQRTIITALQVEFPGVPVVTLNEEPEADMPMFAREKATG